MSKHSNAPFLDNSLTFCGEAFDHKSIARSMTEWAELDEDEQSFAHCHLLVLNLQAQAATQRLLVQARDLLDEVAESLTVALEASLAEEGQAEEVGDEEEGEADELHDLPDEGQAEGSPPLWLAEAMQGDDDDQAGDDERGDQ